MGLVTSDSLIFALGTLSGLGGVALQEDLQLRRVTVGGNDEVSRLMKTGGGTVAVNDTQDKQCLTQST